MQDDIRDRYKMPHRDNTKASGGQKPPARDPKTVKKNPETPNRTQISLNIGLPRIKLPKKSTSLKFLVWFLIILIAVAIWKWPAKNTIPANIRSQLHFKAAFPTKNYDATSFSYDPTHHALSFKATQDNARLIVTEQPLPGNVGDSAANPGQLLHQLGINYYNQTSSKLGVVSVAKFWTGNYTPNGETGIVGTKSAVIFAHPSTDLSQNQWSQFFNSLSY